MNIFELLNERYVLPDKPKLMENFAGVGMQRMAFNRLGIDYEMVGISEIDKFAIQSYMAIHGETKNFGDICNIKGSDLPEIDVFTWSFPCFNKDALVMTEIGYKRIVDVVSGDNVLTHDNTFKEVVRSIDNGLKHTMLIKGMSIDEIVCTPNHKFYARELKRVYFHNPNTQSRRFEQPKWVEAKDLTKNTYLGVAINQKSIIPSFNQKNNIYSDGRSYKPKGKINELVGIKEFWYIVGRYMGDGWLRHQGGIIICCKQSELNEITGKLEFLNIHYNVVKERTVLKVHIPLKEFGDYFKQFGIGASNKRITSDVFDLPINLLEGFVEGYLESDGTFTNGVYKTTSVSRELTYGFAQCVAKVYKTPYRLYKSKRKSTCVIEGRTVNQKTSYCLAFKKESKKQDKAFYEDGYIWFPINKTEVSSYENVYDLEIKDNHSYTVNGVIVHNCTDLSRAGEQKGLSNTRSGLAYEVIRIIKECKENGNLPKVLIMENVVDLVQVKFIREFQEIQLELEQLGYSNYTQRLNSKDYGIPQNRERVFMVSILGDYYYEFPIPIKLEKTMEDLLETNVDKAYWISKKLLGAFMMPGTGKYPRLERFLQNLNRANQHIANAITTIPGNRPTDNFVKVTDKECETKLRKLTELETWRLMGIDDQDLYKAKSSGVSKAQLYKQAGNGLVVDLFAAILKQMVKEN